MAYQNNPKQIFRKIDLSAGLLILSWVAFIILFFFSYDYLFKVFSLLAISLLIIFLTFVMYTKNKKIMDMEKLMKQISQVNEFVQSLKGTMKLSEILVIILRNIVKGLEFDRAIIYVIKENNKTTVEFASGYTINGNYSAPYSCVFDKSKSILARSIIEKKTFIISNAQTNYFCEQVLVDTLNLKEFGLVPIVVQDTSVGVILIDNYINRKPVDESKLKALSVFANQAGIAIENARIHERIESLAVKDGLTEIYNHRYFQEALRNEINKSVKYNRPMSLLFLDLDNFKHFNDTNGHLEGDRLLKEVSAIFKSCIRNNDTLARYGGEEFVIILADADKEKTLIVAERIRKSVETFNFVSELNKPLGNITVSIGISIFPDDAKQPEALIDLADKGLYVAKKSGKNKICFYSAH